MAATVRVSLDSGARVPRAPGAIVAKGTARNVEAIVDLGDRIAVTHHEGYASSLGGTTVRRRADFSVISSITGAFGRLGTGGPFWAAAGPLWRGRHASARLIDPESLAVVDTLPLCSPFAWRDARRLLAHTPVRDTGTVDGQFRELDRFAVDPDEVAAAQIALPDRAGLVQVDVAGRWLHLVIASEPFDPFTHCVLSPDRETVYAASHAGRVVAVQLEHRRMRWERPRPAAPQALSVHALALAPGGDQLAVAGRSADGAADLLVFDTATGGPVRELALCASLARARVTTAPHARLQALAYHPSGWLAIASSGGAIAELRAAAAEPVTAFRAAGAGIEALAFVDGGRALVVGGHEPNLRLWPVDS